MSVKPKEATFMIRNATNVDVRRSLMDQLRAVEVATLEQIQLAALARQQTGFAALSAPAEHHVQDLAKRTADLKILSMFLVKLQYLNDQLDY